MEGLAVEPGTKIDPLVADIFERKIEQLLSRADNLTSNEHEDTPMSGEHDGTEEHDATEETSEVCDI